MRATTYRYLESRLLPAEPIDILDIGAGNGWLSNRLAQKGHRPVAVDIFTDPLDGLGAARHYGISFPLIEAEFDRLPFGGRQFDWAVFNCSLHYSTDYRSTLAEALRCLRPQGRIVVLDSPIYKRREHGERMREERHQHFEHTFGFRSDSVPSIEFLWDDLLPELAQDLRIAWRVHRPWYGLAWHMRPWKARLRRKRPPSRFSILAGSPKR
jgi:ubiquinone/menaquinone biosynthesis C-methylase UbiE